MTAVFQELMSVESYDTSLVRLGYVRKDNVYHADQHSVFVGMSGVLKRNGVSSFHIAIDEHVRTPGVILAESA